MWATILDRNGKVIDVVFSGENRGDQWPGSRVISAQKANTANTFSLPGFAQSMANLNAAVQPGGSLFGLQESNPVDPRVAYAGPVSAYGTAHDPMIGRRIGGINVFGGGLALYSADGELLGGLGVSGDTSCTDHIIAWRLRHRLNLDNVPAGPRTATATTSSMSRATWMDSSTRPVSTCRARATTSTSVTTCRYRSHRSGGITRHGRRTPAGRPGVDRSSTAFEAARDQSCGHGRRQVNSRLHGFLLTAWRSFHSPLSIYLSNERR